jgi:uncharacterized membrane protein YphA (DoxX/SURF4 family)
MSTKDDNTEEAGKGLHIGLWVVQVLLAVAFGFSGFMKATLPMEQILEQMAWAENLPGWLIRFIGISEMAGAVGLVVPGATRIVPKLVGIAGAALAVVMVLAAGLHVMRGEFGFIVVNLALGAMGVFVAWGRLSRRPIEPRAED